MIQTHLGHVLGSWTVAGFAGHPWDQLFRMKLIVRVRSRGMAPEAKGRLFRRHAAAQCGSDTVGGKTWTSGCKVESVRSTVITDPAFEECSFLLEQERIAKLPIAEDPTQIHCR